MGGKDLKEAAAVVKRLMLEVLHKSRALFRHGPVKKPHVGTRRRQKQCSSEMQGRTGG